MVLNSKINKAQCVQGHSKQSEKVRAELMKMIKDDKNKEYLDQIYYAIAKMDLAQEDSVLAIAVPNCPRPITANFFSIF